MAPPDRAFAMAVQIDGFSAKRIRNMQKSKPKADQAQRTEAYQQPSIPTQSLTPASLP